MPFGSKRNSANRHQPAGVNGKANHDASWSTANKHGKSQINGSAKPVVDDDDVLGGENHSKPAALGTIVYQKLPDLPYDGPISWATYLLVFLLTTMFLQNFNIYHTSYYLANRDLLFFTIILLTHHLTWTFFHHVSVDDGASQLFIWLIYGVKWILIGIQAVLLIWFVLQVLNNNSITNSLFLSYPIFLYLSLFGFTLNPNPQRLQQPLVLSKSSRNSVSTIWSRLSSTDLCLIRPTIPCTWSSPGNLSPPADGECISEYHLRIQFQCLSIPSPESVRNDVNSLCSDFIHRLKQLFFNSIVCTYYVAFIPVQFVQQDYVTYDKFWCYKHVAFIWVHTFVMLTMQLMPTSYCISLYKYAMHLGSWRRVDKSTPANIWSPAKIWPPDSLVRYANGVFEAQGIQVAAKPGDFGHSQFYLTFCSPTLISSCLLVIQSAALFYEIILLARATAWQQAVSVSILILFNYYPTFKIVRDRFALSNVFAQP